MLLCAPAISPSALQADALTADICHSLSPMALGLTDAFGLSDAMLSAPIALDWVKYNQYDNQGELA